LYCLGFVTGAVTSPITGALVDRLGRKKAALIYCALEMGINMLEQYPVLAGLILCRMVGGITTNLLSSVFETWLDTEYRRRGFDKERYEIIMRDSVVASNLAAIASGYLAHHLAERFGPVGPFEGAVACTAVAFAVVAFVWTENYGTSDLENIKSIRGYMLDAIQTFKADSKVLRVGIIQGLTTGSIQIFIFLWSPALRELAKNAPKNVLGLDSEGEPAYGLVFGAFMACGVLGGLVSPFVRKGVTALISPLTKATPETIEVEGEVIRPMAVEFLAAASYLVCAGLLLVPCALPSNGVFAFSIALLAFMVYEFMVGIYMPCEGVIRSIYIPSDARCSLMTFPRIIVNIAVSIGVISTEFVSLSSAFCAVSSLMIISAMLQLSLISSREWGSLFGRVDLWKKQAARSMSFSALPCDPKSRDLRRAVSTPTYFFSYDEDGEGKKSK
jgi:MFS transporter, MFS domain-containing protein family, molybdate-anion transporter